MRSDSKVAQGQTDCTARRGSKHFKSGLQVCVMFESLVLPVNLAIASELPSYDLVVPALLSDGVDGLRTKCKLTPGVPLKPMLAKPTKSITEVLDRCEGKKFTCEYKYDGERAQVRRSRCFTETLTNLTVIGAQTGGRDCLRIQPQL